MFPRLSNNDNLHILLEEVEAAIKAFKLGRAVEVDNIPAELVKEGGNAMISAFTVICNRFLANY